MKIFKKIDAFLISILNLDKRIGHQTTQEEKRLQKTLTRTFVNNAYILFCSLFLVILLVKLFHINNIYLKDAIILTSPISYIILSVNLICKAYKLDRQVNTRLMREKSCFGKQINSNEVSILKNELMFTKEALEKKLNHNKEINS